MPFSACHIYVNSLERIATLMCELAYDDTKSSPHNLHPSPFAYIGGISHITSMEKRSFRLPSSHKKCRLSTKPGKTAFTLLERKIKGGKQPPCPEGTWRSDASEGRRRPHPPSQAPEQPFSRWTPSFLPRPSKPLHERP